MHLLLHRLTPGRAPLGVVLSVGALLLGACRGEPSHRGAASPREAPRSAGAAPAAGATAAPREEWDKQEVIRRLTDAGLVVTDSSRHVRHPPLSVTGHLLHVGGGQLEIYLYPTDAERRAESARLDTATVGLPTIYSPRWVISGNLIAILRMPNERAADRVTNTLLAFHTRDGT